MKKSGRIAAAILTAALAVSLAVPSLAATPLEKLNDDLPEKYDLRDVDGVNYAPILRDQSSRGLCWMFGASSALSSHILLTTGLDYTFSPSHGETITSIDGFHPWQRTGETFNTSLDTGGFDRMAGAYMISGKGPVFESDMPYGPNTEDAKSLNADSVAKLPLSGVRVRELEYVTSFVGGDSYSNASQEMYKIKKALMEHGALSVDTYVDANGFSVSDDTYYYVVDAHSAGNHVVTLVGWDDTIPASRFKYTADDGSVYSPHSNGGWLIQNSWGESFGDGGYYWVSYDSFASYICSMSYNDVSTTLGYDKLYSNTPTGVSATMGVSEAGSDVYAANVYTRDKADVGETLNEVMIGLAGLTNYEIYVNPDDSELDLSKMTLAASGTKDMYGYSTVTLDSPIELTGDIYAVAVKYVTPSQSYGVPVYQLTSEIDAYKPDVATSFMSIDGGNEWTEISCEANRYSSAFINAYTVMPAEGTVVTVDCNITDADVVVKNASGETMDKYRSVQYLLPEGKYTLTASSDVGKTSTTFEITSEDAAAGEKTVSVQIDYAPLVTSAPLTCRYAYFNIDLTTVSIAYDSGNGVLKAEPKTVTVKNGDETYTLTRASSYKAMKADGLNTFWSDGNLIYLSGDLCLSLNGEAKITVTFGNAVMTKSTVTYTFK